MNSQFATALSQALEQTRAGHPAEATRIIQAALAGETVQQGGATASEHMPERLGGKPVGDIEDADVV